MPIKLIVALICPLLLPALAQATLVTYEFTGSLAHSLPDTGRPIESVHGYITFDMGAVRTHYQLGDPTSVTNAQSATFRDAIYSFAMNFGNDFAYSAGTGSTLSMWADRMGEASNNFQYTEWGFGASTTTVDGRYFSMLYDRRCDYDLCPEISLDALFSYDNLVRAFGYGTDQFVVRIADSEDAETRTSLLIYQLSSFKKVPEPETNALFGFSLIGAMLFGRRRSALRLRTWAPINRASQ